MNYYKTKSSILSGSSYLEVKKQAYRVFSELKKKTKRKPYVRSAYFAKQKVFFDFFWKHLFQKVPADRMRRMRFLPVALELIQHSRNAPETIATSTEPNILYHRFGGITKDRQVFFVQLKENKRTNRKQLMSVFPEK